MLCLNVPTHPYWTTVASQHLGRLLADHAHCEKKAAANAIHLMMFYSDHEALVREMLTIAEEELAHFRMVLGELDARGIELGRDRGNVYAKQLIREMRQQEPYKLLDKLIVDAFIEARSCERFTLLAKCEAIPEDIRGMYFSLMASEEGHYETYTNLAKQYFPADVVEQRVQEFADIEANIVRNLKNHPTIHG